MNMIKKILKQNFVYKKGEKIIILHDLLKKPNKDYKFRIELAKKWYNELKKSKYDVDIINYNATYSQNADFPKTCFLNNTEKDFEKELSRADIVIALTEYSATAPLHKLADKYGFRAASMPGFNKKMIPALELNYKDIKEKVKQVHDILDGAESALVVFEVEKKQYELFLDLSTRKPHKDDGDCSQKSQLINLPSGECFIAPLDTKQSKTSGFLPIQKKDEVIIYKIEKNNVVDANRQTQLLKKIKQDSAVGNIAEFAFGILGLYGIKSCGRVLLDEKLGMHIALGRNDHFGGNIGPNSFKKKENIWHQDFVYIKEMQPKISIKEVLINKKDKQIEIIKNNKFRIF